MSQLCRNFVFWLEVMSEQSYSSVSEERRSQGTKGQVSGIVYFFYQPSRFFIVTVTDCKCKHEPIVFKAYL